jgi:ribosomal protein S18 acetylase RimI-like enzyme
MDGVILDEAGTEDVEFLVTLMREFYAEADYPLDVARARESFEQLQGQPALGRAFVVRAGSETAGYLVLTLTFSMEYGGRSAFLDDLYIRPAFRGQRVGTAALARLEEFARSLNPRAIHLEVGRDNAAGQSLYRSAGFKDNNRQLLTLQLAPASHEVEDAVSEP